MSYKAISSQTLASAASSVLLSSIPQTFKDLVLVCSIKATAGTPATYLRLNSSLSTYSGVYMFGDGSSVSGSTQPNSSRLYLSTSTDYANFSSFQVQIMDYSLTDKRKNVLSRWGSGTNVNVGAYAGHWESTSAVTSLLIYPDSFNFEIGSTFSLYGIEA